MSFNTIFLRIIVQFYLFVSIDLLRCELELASCRRGHQGQGVYMHVLLTPHVCLGSTPAQQQSVSNGQGSLEGSRVGLGNTGVLRPPLNSIKIGVDL
eukprot:753088-Hanusia_phi.AAC.5